VKSLNDAARTEWYPGDVKPKRHGVYERQILFSGSEMLRFSYWDGIWGGWSDTIKGARKNKGRCSAEQRAPWRGLAEKPE
jgi:hypothetical protein